MGMFDYIKFENYSNLPKPENFDLDLKDLEFQTKSLDNTMSLYIIKNDGSLNQENYFDENATPKKVDFHGVITFYCYHQTDLVDYILDYEAKFTDGLLKEVKLIDYEVVEHESLKLKRERLIEDIKKQNNKLTRKFCFFLSRIFIIYPFSLFGIKLVSLSPGSFRGENHMLSFHVPEVVLGYKKDSFKRKIYGLSFGKANTELCFTKGNVSKEFSFKFLGFGFVLSTFEKMNLELGRKAKGDN